MKTELPLDEEDLAKMLATAFDLLPEQEPDSDPELEGLDQRLKGKLEALENKQRKAVSAVRNKIRGKKRGLLSSVLALAIGLGAASWDPASGPQSAEVFPTSQGQAPASEIGQA